MSDDVYTQRPFKLAMVLYAAIFGLIALDLISDYHEGLEWSHVAIELVVLLIAIIGLTTLWRAYDQAVQTYVSDLHTTLARAQDEAKQWREESKELIQGLSVGIQKQFVRWQLTQAESEVGMLMLKGLSFQQIADVRGASERTVREQARALYRKAGIAGRSELAAFFLEDLLLPNAGS